MADVREERGFHVSGILQLAKKPISLKCRDFRFGVYTVTIYAGHADHQDDKPRDHIFKTLKLLTPLLPDV